MSALQCLIIFFKKSALFEGFLKPNLTKNWLSKRVNPCIIVAKETSNRKPVQNGRQMDQITWDTMKPYCSPSLLCLHFSFPGISSLKITKHYHYHFTAVVINFRIISFLLIICGIWVQAAIFPNTLNIDRSSCARQHARALHAVHALGQSGRLLPFGPIKTHNTCHHLD